MISVITSGKHKNKYLIYFVSIFLTKKVFDFELTEDDMKQLETLDKGESGRTFTFSAFKGYVHIKFAYDKIQTAANYSYLLKCCYMILTV